MKDNAFPIMMPIFWNILSEPNSIPENYKNNILAFGDLLHKIHPLAGQGFNMSLRDIKLLSELIDNKLNLGMQIDGSVCYEFQKNGNRIEI